MLSDGGVVHLRAVRPDDGERMVAFHMRQSPEALYYRYFSPKPTLTAAEVERLVTTDGTGHMGFIALVDDEIVGVGRFDRFRGADEAEIAFMVDGSQWGRGLATVLLEYLVAAGREARLAGFVAQVLPDNRRMLTVLDKAGFDAHRQFADGVIEVELSLDPSADAEAAIEGREQRAEARSVARLLWPSAVAVVACPGPDGEPARQAHEQLVAAGFPGPVHRVGGDGAWDAPATERIEDVPDAVDLAVVALAPDQLRPALEACARKGVRGVVLLTPAEAPADLVALARRSGMRLVGPGALGVVNTDSAAHLHATPLAVAVPPGPIGFLSQSGTLAAAVLERAAAAGLGFSAVVAIGDKADVSANDLLQYWEHDDATQVVALYLQAFGNPRKFSRIARRVSRLKPIVAVKSGRSRVEVGGDEWPDDMLDALLTQTGVIRVDTAEELLDVARVLAGQPVASGRRVAVVANARGPAVLAADAALGADLVVERSVLLDRYAGPEAYAEALATALDDTADAALVIYADRGEGLTDDVLEAVGRVGAAGGKPVLATVIGPEPDGGGDVPVFAFPERAARALGRVASYGAWRARPAGAPTEFDDGAPDDGRALVDAVLAAAPTGRILDAAETEELLTAFGLRTPPQQAVHTAEDAAAAAAEVGFPITLKALGLARLGKVEAGGVALDLHDVDQVRAAFDRMAVNLGDAMRPALVQHMVEPGADIQVVLHQHPRWGSTISVGVGGAIAGALGDGAQRVVPLTDLDARRLVDASPACQLIDDSGSAADRGPLEAVLLRLSWLADTLPEVAMIRLNPLIVGPEVAWVTSARALVRPWGADPDPRLRRL